jgi:alanyl-tRNA synthetase
MNTIKENNLNIHIADRIPVDKNVIFHASVDALKREETAANHTATHLLHFALRQVLGTHIEQKGSSVTSNSFRFDFSHFEKISEDHLREVERVVNKLIREDIHKEEHRELPIEQAREMGAMALFGEKYGDKVRVIKYGDSVELCGGTHATSTGRIGSFKIVSESAVAAGVRRIEAITGRHVESAMYFLEDQLKSIRQMLGNVPDAIKGLMKVLAENDTQKKALQEVAMERVQNLKKALIQESQEVNGIRLFTVRGAFVPDIIKNVAFELHKEFESAALVGAILNGDKPSLVLMYTDDLVKGGADASKDIKEACKLIQGGGGGQKFLATAGGKNPDALNEAYDLLIDIATKQ